MQSGETTVDGVEKMSLVYFGRRATRLGEQTMTEADIEVNTTGKPEEGKITGTVE